MILTELAAFDANVNSTTIELMALSGPLLRAFETVSEFANDNHCQPLAAGRELAMRVCLKSIIDRIDDGRRDAILGLLAQATAYAIVWTSAPVPTR